LPNTLKALGRLPKFYQQTGRCRRTDQNAAKPSIVKAILEGSGIAETEKLSKVVSTPGTSVFGMVSTPADPLLYAELASVPWI
jgi:hypothetical protein